MIPYVFSAGEKNAEEVDWVRLGEEKLTIVNLWDRQTDGRMDGLTDHGIS